jgi:beta-lactamase superfamily II metal-dependent hydrolase
MGTYLKVTHEEDNYYFVITAGNNGWIHKEDTTDQMGLKAFYLDVGQGDGTLLEVGNYRILIDGGPGANMKNYLTNWQYTYLLRANQKVHIDAVYVSHFDSDHYSGLIELLENVNFTFGTVYHNGIGKFIGKNRPDKYNTFLGETRTEGGKRFLKTCFNSLRDLLELQQEGYLQDEFTRFVFALQNAHDQQRLQSVQRLRRGDVIPDAVIENKPFQVQVLGPVCTDLDDFPYFQDESHTVNGHSLVLKITFGTCTLLFGGDLNTDSENYLMDTYRDQPGILEVDVAKSCHHGASEFTIPFMAAVKPYATVISSGDNERYSHPRADAIGCAGRYSKGPRPLVFSTELARSVSKDKIIFGMINLRCDGNAIYMAQMKEAKVPSDMWDSYRVK